MNPRIILILVFSLLSACSDKRKTAKDSILSDAEKFVGRKVRVELEGESLGGASKIVGVIESVGDGGLFMNAEVFSGRPSYCWVNYEEIEIIVALD